MGVNVQHLLLIAYSLLSIYLCGSFLRLIFGSLQLHRYPTAHQSNQDVLVAHDDSTRPNTPLKSLQPARSPTPQSSLPSHSMPGILRPNTTKKRPANQIAMTLEYSGEHFEISNMYLDGCMEENGVDRSKMWSLLMVPDRQYRKFRSYVMTTLGNEKHHALECHYDHDAHWIQRTAGGKR